MKIYNVTNVKKLLKHVTEICVGKIELVSEDGQRLDLTDGTDLEKTFPFYYLNATIKEMELRFSNADDALAMLCFLSGAAEAL